MTNKIIKWAILSAVLTGFATLAYFAWEKFSFPQTKYSLSIKDPYFIPATIAGYTSAKIPYIEMQVAEKVIHTKLDSGFSGDIRIPSEIFRAIEPKTFLKTQNHYGIRGKNYHSNIYTIPHLSIGNMLFKSPRIFEMNHSFEEDGAFYEDGSRRDPDYHLASIGWPTFCMVNLFLDFAHGKIAFCNGLNTLKIQGYPVEEFVVCILSTSWMENGKKLAEYIQSTFRTDRR